MSNERKSIIRIISIIAVIVIAVIGIMRVIDSKGYKREEIKDVKEFKITFQYLTELEDEYSMKLGDEKVIVKIADIEPAVDTSVLGENRHTINIDGEEIVLTILIDDSRRLKLTGKNEIYVPENIDTRELERVLLNDLEIEGPEQLGDVKIDFVYPEEFNLSKNGIIGKVTVLAHYKDNNYNKADFKYTVIVGDEPGTEPEKPEEKPEIKEPEKEPVKEPEKEPEVVEVEKPKPTPKPIPKPSKPVTRPTPKPKPTSKPNNDPRFPLKYPELLPEGAKLIYSSIKPGLEEFHEYSIRRDYPDGSYIKTAHLTFNENVPYSVRLIGQDSNGEILSLNYVIKSQRVEYDWQEPAIEDEAKMKQIAHQFAKAYGFK